MRKKLRFHYPAIIFILCFRVPVFALPAQNVEVATDREYFQIVHRTLIEASHSIQVMMYTIGHYEKYPDSPSNTLIKDLIEAKQRGVEVKVILERGKPNWSVTQKNKKVGQILSSEGVKVAYDPEFVTTHAKLLIIDSFITSTPWLKENLSKGTFKEKLLVTSNFTRWVS